MCYVCNYFWAKLSLSNDVWERSIYSSPPVGTLEHAVERGYTKVYIASDIFGLYAV